jgi:hypothetical protein
MDRLKERYSHVKNDEDQLPINLMSTEDKENVYQSYNQQMKTLNTRTQ